MIHKIVVLLLCFSLSQSFPYDDGRYDPTKYRNLDDGRYTRPLDEGKYVPTDEGKYTYIYRHSLYPGDDGNYKYRHRDGPNGPDGPDGPEWNDYIGNKIYAEKYPYIHNIIEALTDKYVSITFPGYGDVTEESANYFNKVKGSAAVRCEYISPLQNKIIVLQNKIKVKPPQYEETSQDGLVNEENNKKPSWRIESVTEKHKCDDTASNQDDLGPKKIYSRVLDEDIAPKKEKNLTPAQINLIILESSENNATKDELQNAQISDLQEDTTTPLQDTTINPEAIPFLFSSSVPPENGYLPVTSVINKLKKDGEDYFLHDEVTTQISATTQSETTTIFDNEDSDNLSNTVTFEDIITTTQKIQMKTQEDLEDISILKNILTPMEKVTLEKITPLPENIEALLNNGLDLEEEAQPTQVEIKEVRRDENGNKGSYYNFKGTKTMKTFTGKGHEEKTIKFEYEVRVNVIEEVTKSKP